MEIKILTAPEVYDYQKGDFVIFLAGGIQKCQEWQDLVMYQLVNLVNISEFQLPYNRLVIANPRRKNFPIHDPNAAEEQITWEFNMLSKMDYFFMYFDGPTESDQPICFYELGRYLSQMQNRFRNDWINRCCICINNEFKRIQDVIIQSALASNNELTINFINNKTLVEDFKSVLSNSCLQKIGKLLY